MGDRPRMLGAFRNRVVKQIRQICAVPLARNIDQSVADLTQQTPRRLP
jgi:hypothetical protein